MVKNLPAKSAGEMGSIPCAGRYHRPQNKPVCHSHLDCTPELVLCNRRSHRNENPEHCGKEQSCSPQPEKAHAQQQRPSTAKKLIN